MKQIHFITIILILTCINCFKAQQSFINDSLLKYEQDFFYESNNSQKGAILYKKYKYCINYNQLENAYKTFKRLESQNFTINDSNFYWNNTLLCLDYNDYSSAIRNFKFYKFNFDSSSIKTNLLAYITYINYDSTVANYYLNKLKLVNDSFTCLNCFYKFLNYEKKHKNLFLTSSVALPGSGLIFLGKPIKGLTSMVLLTSLGYGIYELLQYNMYINAINWGLGLGFKFYSGQIRLTNKEFHKKENRKKKKMAIACKTIFDTTLKKYEIVYKNDMIKK